MYILSFDRSSNGSGCIKLGFLKGEATPEPVMKLGIRFGWTISFGFRLNS